ncbi:MAG TPA: permease of phosphate ABC transporter [Lachnospiraceae bacterium]|nr:permease of phosphate ABC transporter [Lachnospiraceae bacterium]
MKKLFAVADQYLKSCGWKDMALIKLCLLAMGMLIGMAIPGKSRKAVVLGAVVAFIATYIPLMYKFLPILREGLSGDET